MSLRLLLPVLALAACTESPLDQPPEDEPYVSELYDDPAIWLCHPENGESLCATDLDTTIVHADGSTELRPHVFPEDPEFDCFYVYPTVSMDPTPNSDLEPGVEETFTTLMQFARYSSVCRTFAPIYRQVTLGQMIQSESLDEMSFEVGYADVEDAWRHYLDNYNDGRPVLLVGHSQGSRVLSRLISREIEPDPEVHARMVGAHLIGMSVPVPEGDDQGGDLARTPICSSLDEWGCVTTYLSFRPTEPPGDDVFVGQPPSGQEVPCVHPAGQGALSPVFPSDVPGIVADFLAGTTTPWEDTSANPPIETPYFALPGLIEAECQQEGAFGFLGVTFDIDPEDPRVNDVGGDFLQGWGLHLIDMNIAQDDLVALAARQAAARP